MKGKHIIIVIILFLGIGGFVYFNMDKEIYKEFPTEIITRLDTEVAPDIREFTENRIAETREIIADTASEEWQKLSAHVSIGNDYVILGDLASAKKEIEEALSFDEENGPVLVTYAYILDRMQDARGAFDAIERAIAAAPDESQAWLLKLDLEKKYRKVYESLDEVYQEALVATNYHINIVTDYARFLSNIGKIEESITMWRQAQELEPSNTELYQSEIDLLEVEQNTN